MNSWNRLSSAVRQRLRAYVFARDGYVCQIRGPKCTARAEELDHIIPRHIAPELILDPNNARAACRVCNRGRRYPKSTASRDW